MTNNVNYQLEMEQELQKIRASDKKPRLVLHVCCAPCSSAVLERLNGVFEIIAYYDNPNIAPEAEFQHRAAELKRLCNEMPLADARAVIAPYEPEAFYEAVRGHEDDPETGARCTICYALRLRRSAAYAASVGADYFTTTLSISPLKDARRLNALGGQIAASFGVPYLFSDFKKKDGYRRSCALSAQYGLYRQDFCGCVFSREQRHPEIEDAETIRAHLNRPHAIETHDVIGSTNDRAKALAQAGAPHGTVVVADTQTAGRGRFDRRFHSPEKSGVYMSVILRSGLSPARVSMLTPMAAVAVSRAIARIYGLETQIKWVNDVLLGGKKVCGILCEAGVQAGGVAYVVIGIGINVSQTEFPEDLRQIAASIQNYASESAVPQKNGQHIPSESADLKDSGFADTVKNGSRAVSRGRLIAEILNGMDALLDAPEACLEEYRARSSVVGKRITVHRGGEVYPAEAIGIDDTGALIVRTADGVRALNSGEVSIRAARENC